MIDGYSQEEFDKMVEEGKKAWEDGVRGMLSGLENLQGGIMNDVIKEDSVFSVDIGDTPIEDVKEFLNTNMSEQDLIKIRSCLKLT